MRRRAADATQRGQVAEENRRRPDGTANRPAACGARGVRAPTSKVVRPISWATRRLQANSTRSPIRSNAAREAYGYKVQGWATATSLITRNARAPRTRRTHRTI